MQALVLQRMSSGRTLWKLHGLERQRQRFADEPERTAGESDFHRQFVRRRQNHALNPTPPCEEKHDPYQNECQAETSPESEGTPSPAKAKPGAQRQADDPVGREMTEHGRARIARTTKRSGRNGLNAVKQLKGGARRKEKNGAVNDHIIGRVQARNPSRKEKKQGAGAGHERGAEEDGGAAGVARTFGISAADGLADTHGSGGGEAERYHVGERNGVQSDLVAGKRDGSQAPDERSDQREDANLQRDLHGCGKAQGDEATDALQFRLNWRAQQLCAVLLVVPEQIANEDCCKIDACPGRRPTGTDRSHRGCAEFAVDQNPVADGVDDVRSHQGEGDGANQVHGLDASSHREIQQKWQRPPGQSFGVRNSEGDDLRRDAGGAEQGSEEPDGHHQYGSKSQAEIDTVHERAMAVFATARAEGLSDQSVQTD